MSWIAIEAGSMNYHLSAQGIICHLKKKGVSRWFGNCGGVRVPEHFLVLGESTFAGSEIKRVRLRRALQTIGKGCFYNCAQLEETIFDYDSALKQIGESGIQVPGLSRSEFLEVQRLLGPLLLWMQISRDFHL
jgi:hypothetical protein